MLQITRYVPEREAILAHDLTYLPKVISRSSDYQVQLTRDFPLTGNSALIASSPVGI